MAVYYSTRKRDGNTYKTSNAEVAYRWFTEDLLVIVHGNKHSDFVYLIKKGRIVKLPFPDKFDRIADYIRKGYTDENDKAVSPFMMGTYPANPTRSPSGGITESLFALKILEDKDVIKVPTKAKKALKTHNRKKKSLKELTKMIPVKHDLGRLLAYGHSKGLDGSVTRLYHGTHVDNVGNIIENGFSLSRARNGMLGQGVYLGTLNKARSYSDGIILVVSVILGKCKELEKVEHLNTAGNELYDSMHMASGSYAGVYGGTLRNEEWIIRDPLLTEVIGIMLKEPPRW